MKIWLDDVRTPPSSEWVWVKTAPEAISLIDSTHIDAISLDHDLGEVEVAGTGYDVALHMEELAHTTDWLPPKVMECHSANPVGRQRITNALQSIKKKLRDASYCRCMKILSRTYSYPWGDWTPRQIEKVLPSWFDELHMSPSEMAEFVKNSPTITIPYSYFLEPNTKGRLFRPYTLKKLEAEKNPRIKQIYQGFLHHEPIPYLLAENNSNSNWGYEIFDGFTRAAIAIPLGIEIKAKVLDFSEDAPEHKKIEASILDVPRASLSSDVWDTNSDPPKLNQSARAKIYEGLHYLARAIPEYALANWPMYIVGSITGIQWSPTSDVDVQLTAQLEIPEEEIIELRQRAAATPNVYIDEHPINFYIHEKGVLPPFAYIYDVNEDSWVSDVPGNSSNYYEKALAITEESLKGFLHKFDRGIGEAWRDIKDYNELAKEIQRRGTEELIPQLEQKAKEIVWDISVLLNEYERAKEARRAEGTNLKSEEQFQLSLANIRYKLLEHYGYSEVLKALEKIKQQIQPSTEENSQTEFEKAREIRKQLAEQYEDLPEVIGVGVIKDRDQYVVEILAKSNFQESIPATDNNVPIVITYL